MKKIGIVMIFLAFFISLYSVSAVSADFSCPESVINNQEFECAIRLRSFTGNYDVKADIFQNKERISRVFSFNEWKSTNYYVENFLFNEDPRKLKLIVNGSIGEANGVLKLRKNGTVQYERNFSIFIAGNNLDEAKKINESIINLNSDLEGETIYESKNEKIKEYAVWAFFIFLLFIAIVLIITLWHKRKSRQS